MKIQYNYSCFDSDYFQRLKTSIFVFIFNLFSVEFFISSKNRTEISTKPNWTFAGIHFSHLPPWAFFMPWKNKTRKRKEIERKAELIQHILRKGNYFFRSHVPSQLYIPSPVRFSSSKCNARWKSWQLECFWEPSPGSPPSRGFPSGSAFHFPVPANSFICKSSVWQTLCEKLTLAQNTKVRETQNASQTGCWVPAACTCMHLKMYRVRFNFPK